MADIGTLNVPVDDILSWRFLGKNYYITTSAWHMAVITVIQIILPKYTNPVWC
jgi:hypothetical protein